MKVSVKRVTRPNIATVEQEMQILTSKGVCPIKLGGLKSFHSCNHPQENLFFKLQHETISMYIFAHRYRQKIIETLIFLIFFIDLPMEQLS